MILTTATGATSNRSFKCKVNDGTCSLNFGMSVAKDLKVGWSIKNTMTTCNIVAGSCGTQWTTGRILKWEFEQNSAPTPIPATPRPASGGICCTFTSWNVGPGDCNGDLSMNNDKVTCCCNTDTCAECTPNAAGVPTTPLPTRNLCCVINPNGQCANGGLNIISNQWTCCCKNWAGTCPQCTSLRITPVPTTEEPWTPVPTTQVPTTQVPTTQVPTTQVPTTQVPTTEVPTTKVPTTQVPWTPTPTEPSNPSNPVVIILAAAVGVLVLGGAGGFAVYWFKCRPQQSPRRADGYFNEAHNDYVQLAPRPVLPLPADRVGRAVVEGTAGVQAGMPAYPTPTALHLHDKAMKEDTLL
jgi:hypothetical protein